MRSSLFDVSRKFGAPALAVATIMFGYGVGSTQDRSDVHEVRAGDTLYSIAVSHRLSLTEIQSLNPALEDPDVLQVGQRVRVCCATSRSTSSTRSTRGERRALTSLLRTPGQRSRRWSAIVVHHTASSGGTIESIDHFHRNVRGFPRGMAYHLVIGNGNGIGDGEVALGDRWRRQQPGAHVASHLRDPETGDLVDNIAIGIALVGNFEEGRPSARQRESLSRLVGHLRREHGIPANRVFGHGEVHGAQTACPGRRLDLGPVQSR